jgi:UDP-N-acetylglucosamine acyltransferase
MAIDGSAQVHPTAVIEAGARLAAEVRVGPYAVIGAEVQLEAECSIGAHAVLQGRTTLGAGCVVGAHAVIGGAPQIRGDLRAGELQIGARTVLREFVSVHCGSGDGRTELGADNLLMAYAHVAHDCRLGDRNELANGAQLAGHVQLADHVTIGGLAALHQFVRVGEHAMIGGGSMVAQDVPPYCQVSGDRARVYGINRVGLKRAGYDEPTRELLSRGLRALLAAPTLAEGVEAARALEAKGRPAISTLLTFAQGGQRGLCRPVW